MGLPATGGIGRTTPSREDLMIRRMIVLATSLMLCVGTASTSAHAADPWPTRPVRVVVPFSASGTADLLARLMADKLSASLGHPFVIENRPGAGGTIGQEQVARATPDGYTLVISSLGSFVINPVFTPVSFDQFKDFTHIAYLGGQPVVLLANKDLPYKSLGELVAYAKTHPGAVTYATISIGSQTQLLNEQFQRQAGIVMTHVPYRGAGQIANDVLGGHLATGLVALAVAAGQLKGGTARGLAISTEQRLPEYPDVPTYKELGYPEMVASTWFALSGPANMPRDIVDRLNAEIVKAFQAPELQARFTREAIDTKMLDAAAFTAFFKAEAARWTPLAKAVAAQVKADEKP
jgi:tripartite-type tricarboxylate transporter receptor subunit TctC